ALGALATAVLNARGRFAASVIAPIVYNLGVILAALFLVPIWGVTGLAVGVVGASLCHLLVPLPPLRTLGFTYDRHIALQGPGARQSRKLLAPRALGLGVTQIAFIVMTGLASTLGNGALTAFTVAFALLQIPIGIIGVPLGVVVLPSLSHEAAMGRHDVFAGLVSRAIRLVVFVMIPITGISIVLRHDIVQLLFGYGKYGPAALDLTAATLAPFLLGL